VPWTTPKTDFDPGDVLTAAEMNAIGNNLDAIGGAWTAYTPTWTNLTVGNATQDSRYIAAGRLVIVNLKITLGSTSSVGTIPEFSLPENLDGSYTTGDTIGDLRLFDTSADGVFWAKALPRTALTGARPFVDQVNGTYNAPGVITATVPFTWATGDAISGTLIYESDS
jgi:hypothetical protein